MFNVNIIYIFTGVATGIVQTFGYTVWFAVCKMYPWAAVTLGVEIVWSMFSVFCLINVMYAIFLMPETKGKTLEQILLYFEPSKKI